MPRIPKPMYTTVDIHIEDQTQKREACTGGRRTRGYVLFDIKRRPSDIGRAEEKKMKPSKQIKLINIEEKYKKKSSGRSYKK